MSVRENISQKPLKGVRVTARSMTIRPPAHRNARGARRNVRWQVQYFSPPNHAASAIAQTGTPVFAWKARPRRILGTTLKAILFPDLGPELVVDDGGDGRAHPQRLRIGKRFQSGAYENKGDSHEVSVVKTLPAVSQKRTRLWTKIVKS